MGFFKKVGDFVKKSVVKVAALAVAAVGVFAGADAHAADAVANTINMPTGIDIPVMIGSGVAVLGGIVAVAIAAWAGWVLVKKCLQWIRKSLS